MCIRDSRDPLGIKPLYYANYRGELLFASELRSLLRFPDFRPGLDPASVNKYLALGYIPAPSTAYAGVRKLEPGQMLTWSPPVVGPNIFTTSPSKTILSGQVPSMNPPKPPANFFVKQSATNCVVMWRSESFLAAASTPAP